MDKDLLETHFIDRISNVSTAKTVVIFNFLEFLWWEVCDGCTADEGLQIAKDHPFQQII